MQNLTLNRPGGGGGMEVTHKLVLPSAVLKQLAVGSTKLCDFYYIQISFHFEYKPVRWDIHCCHGNAIVEECLV